MGKSSDAPIVSTVDLGRAPVPGSVPVSADAPTDAATDGAPIAASAAAFGDGDRYAPGAELGRGGLGRVTEAIDRRLARPVAVKELVRGGGEDRFVREALITARLEHPAIVPVHDRGERDGVPYYVMKRVDGRPLSEVIAQATTPAARMTLLEHVIAVCDAVGYAHSRGVIHRDLKPHNVLVGSFGETVVIDWGLAKELGVDEPAAPDAPARGDAGPSSSRDGARSSALTVLGTVLGTPGFMAPEQADGAEVDQRVDVYAIGVMLGHVLTGELPRRDGALPPLDGIAPELVAIIAKATAREPDARYRDARALAADLRSFRTGRLVSAHAYTWWQRVRRFVGRHRAAVVAAAFAAIAVAAVTVFAFVRVVAARDRMTAARDNEAARVAELRWLQAQAELERLPARALDWLRLLDGTSFTRWDAARVVAADAIARGVPEALTGVAGSDLLASLGDGSLLAAGADGRVRRRLSGGAVELVHRHDLTALDLEASPGGGYAVSVGEDGVAVIIEGGRAVHQLRMPGPLEVVRVAESRFAVGAADGLYIYSRTGELLQRVATEAGVQHVVRLSDSWAWFDRGRTLGVVGDDGTTRVLWRADAPLLWIVPAPDGKHLAVTTDPGRGVHVIDVATGERRLLAGPEESRLAIHWTADARLLAVGIGPGLESWSLATGERTVVPMPSGHNMIVPRASDLILSGIDGAVRVITEEGVLLAELHGHPDRLEDLQVSGDDAIVSASSDGTVLRWRTAPSLGRRYPTGSARFAVTAVRADVVAAGGEDGVAILELATGDVRRFDAGSVLALRATRSGIVVAGAEDGRLTSWDVAAWRELGRQQAGKGDPWVQGIAIAPDDARVAVLTYDGTIELRRLPDLSLLAQADETPSGATADFDVAFTPDGRSLIVANFDGTIRIHDATTLAVGRRVKAPMEIQTIALSPDGRTLAVAAGERRIALVELANGGSRILVGHRHRVTSLEFSPDGTRLLSASYDGDSRIWDVASGVSRPLRRGVAVRGAAWALDGRAIFDVTAEGVVREARDDLPWGEALRAWLRTRVVSGV